MKLACFRRDGGNRLGVYGEDGIIEVSGALAATYPSVRAVIERDGFADLEAWAEGRSPDHGPEDVSYLPPLFDAEKVICVGVNYPKRHPVHGEVPPPDSIFLFNKWEGALVGHLEPLIQPPAPAADSFDYEGELVLDPFAGTFTTGLAAQKLGRRAAGVDISEAYLQQAVKRLGAVSLPMPL